MFVGAAGRFHWRLSFGSIARNSVAIMLLMVSVGCLSCVGLWGAPWCVLLCLSFSLAKVSLGLRNVLRQEDQTISTIDMILSRAKTKNASTELSSAGRARQTRAKNSDVN